MRTYMSDGGGNNYDYAIYESLFEAVAAAKKEFESEFNSCYTELKKIYREMESAKGFKGKTKEGFMETFEILLMYQEDLIKLLPELYESFENFSDDLSTIKKESVYTELGK